MTRRQFFRAGCGMLAALGGATDLRRAGAGERPAASQMAADAGRAAMPLVVEASSPHVIGTHGVRMSLLEDMLEQALCRLTRKGRVDEAWQSLLGPADVIGIKFNRSGAAALGTMAPVARVLLASLRTAGFDPANIVLLEADEETMRSFKTARADLRYSDEVVDFGCGEDSFIAALEPITALINVPFYKTHQLAVMTGCLKNLSHGLIRRPSRFHANGCDPAIGRIVASPPVRSRMRLHIVNGLRMVVAGGSRVTDENMADSGRLVVSRDPVAADAFGYERLNEIRRERRLGPLLPLPQIPAALATAHRLGLGEYDAERYEVAKLRL